jgi:hypothetical protein
MARIDAAQKRFYQPVEDLVADPDADELAHRDVVRRHRGRSRDRRLLDDAGRHQGVHVGRDTHDGRRHRPQRVPRPDGGGDGGGMHDRVAEPDLGAEVGRFRAPGQQGLGADVEGDSVDVGEPELAAEAIGALEQQHVGSRPAELIRGREPRDSPADDRDLHL